MSNQLQPYDARSLKDRLLLIQYAEYSVYLSQQECVERLLKLSQNDDLSVQLVKRKSEDDTQELKICFKRVRGADWSTYLRIEISRGVAQNANQVSRIKLVFIPLNPVFVLALIPYSAFWIFMMYVNFLYIAGLIPILFVALQLRLRGRKLLSIVDDTFNDVRLVDS